jgi:hypothetical protein
MAGKKVSGPPEWQNEVAKLLGIDPAAPGKDITVTKVMDVTQIKDHSQPSSVKSAEEGPALFCPNPCAEILLHQNTEITLAPGLTILDQDSAAWGNTNQDFFEKIDKAPLKPSSLHMSEANYQAMMKWNGQVVADEIQENLAKASFIHPNNPAKTLIEKIQSWTMEELPGEGYGNLKAIQKLNLSTDELKGPADLGDVSLDSLIAGGGFPAGMMYGHHNGKSWMMQDIMAQGLANKMVADLYASTELKVISHIHDAIVLELKTPEEKEVPMPENKLCTLCGGTFGACSCCVLDYPSVLHGNDAAKITWDQATKLVADFKAMMKSNPKVPFVVQPLTNVTLERFELHKSVFGDYVVAMCTTQPNWAGVNIPVDPANPDWEGFARKMFYTHFGSLWLKHCESPGRLAVNFHIMENKADGSVYSVVTLFRYYGNLQKPNANSFGSFDLEVELNKYLTPKPKYIKGPNYDITFHELKSESLVAEFKAKLLSESKKETVSEQLVAAKANLKIITDAIWEHKGKLTGPGLGGEKEDTLTLISLKTSLAGWKKKIQALEIEAGTEQLAQAPGGKFFEPSHVATPADSSKEIFGPLQPLGQIPELAAAAGTASQEALDLDSLAQMIKTPLDEYFLGFQMKITDLPGYEEELHGTGDESFTKHTLFTLRVETISMLKNGVSGFDISSWVTERTPACCHYATFDECKNIQALNQFFDKMAHEHFELKHGNAAKNHLSLVNAAKALIQAHQHAKNSKLGPAWAANQFNAQLPTNAPNVLGHQLLNEEWLANYAMDLESFFLTQNEEGFQEPEGFEVFELTLSNLTQEEVDDIMKTITKSKSKQEVLVHKSSRKEVGTKSKAVVIWPFESSSFQANSEPVLYKTQLNEDGTVSCNCFGWTIGSAKNSAGRFCKHTKAIQVEAEMIYKKWKKGLPLGSDFDIVPAAVANATSKTLYSALKEKVAPGQEIMFKAKRIVEV